MGVGLVCVEGLAWAVLDKSQSMDKEIATIKKRTLKSFIASPFRIKIL